MLAKGGDMLAWHHTSSHDILSLIEIELINTYIMHTLNYICMYWMPILNLIGLPQKIFILVIICVGLFHIQCKTPQFASSWYVKYTLNNSNIGYLLFFFFFPFFFLKFLFKF